MADTKISDLPAVATPAASDEFAVNQGGLSKKVTLQQISGATGNFSPIGTSRISRTDATHIALGVGVIPLLVNSIWQTRVIGTAVSIDTTGLAVNTTYFVYAADNAGSTVIELSTTGHSTDTAFGVETKTGDTTRTLVGMVRTNASTQFVDTAAQRFVISWFSKQLIAGLNRLTTADGTATGTSYSELSTTLLRAEFLTWATEAVQLTAAGAAQTVTNNGFIALGIDNTTAVSTAFLNSSDQSGQKVIIYKTTLAEGYHFGTVLGKIITSGTVTAFGSTSLGGETVGVMTIQAEIRG